jgi:sugar-specific transcriptional regulator TrmB
MQLERLSRLDSETDEDQGSDLELLTVRSRINTKVRVYLYLARFGAQKAQRIAEALGVHRTEAYKILRRLEKQGLVSCVFERPMKFVSVPFEKALGSLIEERRQRVHQMEQWKKELLKTWRSLPTPEDKVTRKETFQVLEGRRQVGVKATEILGGCTSKIHMILRDETLLWLFNSPFFDDLEKLAKKKMVKVSLITNFSPTSTYVLEEVDLGKGDFDYKEIEDSPCFIISDTGQMLLLMRREGDDGKPYAMWTNYETLVQSFKLLFNLLWTEKSAPQKDVTELPELPPEAV